jgi:hypothetical protein
LKLGITVAVAVVVFNLVSGGRETGIATPQRRPALAEFSLPDLTGQPWTASAHHG